MKINIQLMQTIYELILAVDCSHQIKIVFYFILVLPSFDFSHSNLVSLNLHAFISFYF